jgi:hypothetical protein
MLGSPPRLVAVPTHFFKVVLAESKHASHGKQHALAAFVMPNAAVLPDVRLPCSTGHPVGCVSLKLHGPMTLFPCPLAPLLPKGRRWHKKEPSPLLLSMSVGHV